MSDSDIELTRLSSWGREALALEIIRLQASLGAAEKLAEEAENTLFALRRDPDIAKSIQGLMDAVNAPLADAKRSTQ
jgi:hypothetical protein